MKNGAGWLSLTLGAFALTYALFQAGNFALGHGFAASTVGICAISYGIFALGLRRRLEATLYLVPVVGILLGIAGTAIMGTYVAAHYLQNEDAALPDIGIIAGTDFSQMAEPAPHNEPTGAPAETAVPVAPSSTPTSATDEYYDLAQRAASAAFLMKQLYAGTKPAGLTVPGSDGMLKAADGQPLTQLPAGTAVTYSVSVDQQHFTLTLIGATFGARVTYDSVSDTLTG